MTSTYKQFKELGYARLHKELLKMISQSRRLMTWFDAGERLNMLPALLAMKDLVAQPGRREPDPSKPNWEDECRILGITPEVVRQWKKRTAAETDIRTIVGEKPKAQSAKDDAAARAAQAMKRLQALVEAVVEGDEARAEKLAYAYAQIYGFGG
jgi:hypothetical protein